MPDNIVLSPDQVEALAAMKKWYESPDKKRQPFFLGGFAGSGKEQPITSLVQTPKGPVTIGSIKVGDFVFGRNGRPTMVTGVFPQGIKPVFKITFRDKSSTRCGLGHLWHIKTAKIDKVVPLSFLIESGLKGNSGDMKYRVPLCEPVEYDNSSPTYDPYMIGALIGNGYLGGLGVKISLPPEKYEILNAIKNYVAPHYRVSTDTCPSCPRHTIIYNHGRLNPLKVYLGVIGLRVKSPERFIPDEYMFAPVNDRIALLHGLMDTDGCVRNNRTSFSTTSPRLAHGIMSLVQSLGGTAIMSSADRGGRYIRTEYHINVKTPFNPFRMSQKADKWSPSLKNSPSRCIMSIEPDGEEEQVCIMVDAEDSLYLTDNFIVTHNTVVCEHFLKEIGIGEHTKTNPGAVTAAYTGMAAKVMRSKGIKNATTIHKMIYRLIEPSEEEFERMEREMRAASRTAVKMKDGDDKNILLAHIGSLHKKLNNFFSPSFVLDLFGPASTAKLFVLDEVSMVSDEIGRDVMKFGVPVLVVGDPFQLPPVDNSAGYFTGREPDSMLTKIHRQAEDNPIIRLATIAREGGHIPFKAFGDGVEKLPVSAMNAQRLLSFDQVICGKNVTRFKIGREMRKLKGIKSDIPTGREGESVICKRNDERLGIVNGERIVLTNVKKGGPCTIRAMVESAEPVNGGSKPKECSVYTGHFMQHADFQKDRFKKEWKHQKERDNLWADWGDIITVHGIQGSERESICVIDDGFKVWGQDAPRMLYTAITRARSKLTIYG